MKPLRRPNTTQRPLHSQKSQLLKRQNLPPAFASQNAAVVRIKFPRFHTPVLFGAVKARMPRLETVHSLSTKPLAPNEQKLKSPGLSLSNYLALVKEQVSSKRTMQMLQRHLKHRQRNETWRLSSSLLF